ncbi:hypothetical protein CPAST_c00470 [Clostridium pasteurianum DSM 525 = ATCC 6013]|uniref:DUF2508 domain-containing protein n=1 Tax=Clostridium pasteurianum DSM 525 = ATCC 6013 TaxID=1262449 RepID=A0A0H3IXI5_CLOPA|nr:YaaL family protein [Clostridium pasteurianum]AJA46176.1 hypothetical protein CPAST_c00470 [Clostridium pasteurianum DSM 525 = ATCC 6013]AJA50164.1 hypothetical protein CLPA_c00470 [Clostridium pasteurianum DSM 525 = ATCC 6013]AOZ73636.1 hypothetical protein AQ983_00235 [Clostridium pasteurianum DSM 525 = ATCC 6013]AOZ77433.1 hypothetical protein AQ984_00235 [Clostridium pasteurianum]ELP57766.1 hypothetical protein F502_18372 [Clostridium pasteurianum DSM 525 = ATCC 6013]
MIRKKDIKLNKNTKYDLNQKDIIIAIEEARKELQACRDYFELVNEPVLVDYAIYKEAAAKSRYIYLLEEAKKLNIKVDGFNIYTNKEKVD